MKRLALLLALLLFLSGCDLRNRRPSEEFISDGSVPPAQAQSDTAITSASAAAIIDNTVFFICFVLSFIY